MPHDKSVIILWAENTAAGSAPKRVNAVRRPPVQRLGDGLGAEGRGGRKPALQRTEMRGMVVKVNFQEFLTKTSIWNIRLSNYSKWVIGVELILGKIHYFYSLQYYYYYYWFLFWFLHLFVEKIHFQHRTQKNILCLVIMPSSMSE